MRRRPFRDIAEELELRELTPAQWADEAGVPIERVAYWIALVSRSVVKDSGRSRLAPEPQDLHSGLTYHFLHRELRAYALERLFPQMAS